MSNTSNISGNNNNELDWDALMESNLIDKQSLNHLVLNYLIFEGYESSTVKFAKEIGIDLNNKGTKQDDDEDEVNPLQKNLLMGINSIKIRNEIKLNILNGEVQLAINKLNLNYPDLLEQNNFLHFKLLLLNLIEMIRNNNEDSKNDDNNQELFVMNIIKFAQDKLTNKAIKNVKFMEELELTMTLLLYSNNKDLLPAKLNELFEFKLRRDIADLVNKSILVKDSNNLIDLNYKKKFYEVKHEDNDNNNGNNEVNNDVDEISIDDNDEDDDGLNSHIIDSNLKKMIKLWIWSENKAFDKNLEYPRLNLD
ncbi:unnamed protein product [Wickerhamomyces anomalus]